VSWKILFVYLKPVRNGLFQAVAVPDRSAASKSLFGLNPAKAGPYWVVSSVGSEHLPYKQGVTGSNPVPPTLSLLFHRVLCVGMKESCFLPDTLM